MPPAVLRLQAVLLRGTLRSDAGDIAAARAELQAASALAHANDKALTPSLRADLEKLRGTIARLDGDAESAARAFEAEVTSLRSAKRHRDMGYALARAGEAHLSAGRAALAADRYFLAARSLGRQGEGTAARGFADASLAAALQANDAAAGARARRLLEELTARDGP